MNINQLLEQGVLPSSRCPIPSNSEPFGIDPDNDWDTEWQSLRDRIGFELANLDDGFDIAEESTILDNICKTMLELDTGEVAISFAHPSLSCNRLAITDFRTGVHIGDLHLNMLIGGKLQGYEYSGDDGDVEIRIISAIVCGLPAAA